MFYSTVYASPVGMLTLACDGESLVGLWREGQKYFGHAVANTMQPKDGLPVFDAAREWLDRYFAGSRPAINELPLRFLGSGFRQEVWRMLCEIPYGEVTTYGSLAKQMAAVQGKAHMSGQAVGGAVGHNPLSIIVPCHRVVGANGSLTGYAGGVDTKVKLLKLEGVDMTGLFVPGKGTAL